MKRIRKSKATRILSWVLSITMIAPIVLGLIAPVTAHAQGTTGSGTVQTVIVIDFKDSSGDRLGPVLARQATDQTAVEMAGSGRYDVLKRDEVIRTANELGLKPPYDLIAKTKLATQLGASAIVEGELKYVKEGTSKRGGPRTVQAGLLVRLSEASSGDLLSGAAQIGEATARPGQSDRDSLAQEATSNAAILDVRQLLSNNLPEGTVISSVGQAPNIQILVNRGQRDGVEPGMEMIVLRERQRVAKIRITNVFPTDSEAEIVDAGLGIRPEDRIRAVFPMPGFTTRGELVKTARATHPTNAISTIGKILLILAVGLVITQAAKGGSTVTGVTAEADTVNNGPAVQLVWRDNLFGSGQVLEYHIWRTPDAGFNFTGTPVAAVAAGQHQYTDFPNPFTFWDGTRSYLQVGPPNGNNNGGNGTGTQATSTTPAAGAVLGFTPGQTYVYQVDAVIRRPIFEGIGGGNNGGGGGGNGNGGGTEDIESSTVNSGPTTPIFQPQLQSPSDAAQNVNLGSVTVAWQSVQGADEFQVEVSTDRTFKNRSLIATFHAFSTAPNSTGVTQTLTIDLSNNAILRRDPTYNNFVNRVPGAPRPTLFFRVGGRNSGDRPGPVDWITRNHNTNDRTFRWIYSLARSFQPADVPPPPPGG